MCWAGGGGCAARGAPCAVRGARTRVCACGAVGTGVPGIAAAAPAKRHVSHSLAHTEAPSDENAQLREPVRGRPDERAHAKVNKRLNANHGRKRDKAACTNQDIIEADILRMRSPSLVPSCKQESYQPPEVLLTSRGTWFAGFFMQCKFFYSSQKTDTFVHMLLNRTHLQTKALV